MGCQLLGDAISQDPRIHVVAAVTRAAEASQVVRDMSPDIVLIGEDIEEQPKGGFELVRRLQTIKPDLSVVMLLDRLNGSSVVDAFRAHSSGVFIRDGSVESLRKCIHTVFSGQVWASTEVLRFVLKALAGTSMSAVDPRAMSMLTKREREVVALAVDGVRNREIARRLSLSEHTVKNYLFSIFGKLGVSSRLELTLAVKREWFQDRNIVSLKHSGTARRDESFDWLRILAENGLASAQLLFGQMYAEGRGVPHDRTQAYKLFLLAEKSAQILDISRNARRELERDMTAMEIAEAQCQATSWLEENREQIARRLPMAKAR
jgi:DNA-binding NarL/FixJ family response regulator